MELARLTICAHFCNDSAMKSQRYVTFKSEVFRWEEKEPYTHAGTSIHGGFEYDMDADKLKCHICSGWFKSIGQHIEQLRRPDRRGETSGHPSMTEYRKIFGVAGLDAPGTRAKHREHRRREAQQQDPDKVRRHLDDIRLLVKGVKKNNAGRAEAHNIKGVCREQVLAAIRTKASILGTCPYKRDVSREVGRFAIRHFGSWQSACHAAGYTASWGTEGTGATREEAIETLRDFYVLNKRPPVARDLNTSPRLYSPKVYHRLFGSFAAALECAGLLEVSKKHRSIVNRANGAISNAARQYNLTAV